MIVVLSETTRTARMQVVADQLDGGTMRFYDGDMAVGGDLVITGTLIATLGLSNPSGVVSVGRLILDPISPDLTIDATGTITWVRLVDSGGLFVMDLDCGVADSGAAVILTKVDAIINGSISVSSGVIVDGNS